MCMIVVSQTNKKLKTETLWKLKDNQLATLLGTHVGTR